MRLYIVDDQERLKELGKRYDGNCDKVMNCPIVYVDSPGHTETQVYIEWPDEALTSPFRNEVAAIPALLIGLTRLITLKVNALGICFCLPGRYVYSSTVAEVVLSPAPHCSAPAGYAFYDIYLECTNLRQGQILFRMLMDGNAGDQRESWGK